MWPDRLHFNCGNAALDTPAHAPGALYNIRARRRARKRRRQKLPSPARAIVSEPDRAIPSGAPCRRQRRSSWG